MPATEHDNDPHHRFNDYEHHHHIDSLDEYLTRPHSGPRYLTHGTQPVTRTFYLRGDWYAVHTH